MIARAVDAFKRGEFLQEFVPVPQPLKDTISGSYGDAEQQALLEAQTMNNLSTYGYANWYDFCVNEWGTKWDVGDEDTINTTDDGLLVAFFDSAWAPPIQAYEKLMGLGFDVVAWYFEPGMAFVGKWDNGDDNCMQYGDYTADTVREAIGEELDDMFNISEDMSQWEEENEE
jgi:hypothetical protein